MKSFGNTIAAVFCVGAVSWAGIRVYEHYVSVSPSDIRMASSAVLAPADPSVFSPFQVVPPFPAITNAPVVAGNTISGEVTENELVLGVELNGEARAYPINMLTGPDREIINDRLGGVAIAATW
jgi:hypothetical protein